MFADFYLGKNFQWVREKVVSVVGELGGLGVGVQFGRYQS